MLVPEDESLAQPMMFLLLIVWGSWPACRKMGGSGNIEFEMSYVLSQFVVSIVLCASLGMIAAEDVKHFNGSLFTDVLADELQQKPKVFALSVLAGVCLCIGDFVMACAIDLLGVTIACPVGFGIPLTLGSTLNYVIEPKANPWLIFSGILCCVSGMLSDTASHANRKEEISTSSPASASCDLTTCETAVATTAPASEKQPQEDGKPIELVISECQKQEDSSTSWNWKLLLVPIFGGSFCAAAGAICTAAGALGGLDPYVIAFAFMVGQLATLLPVLSIYVLVTKPKSYTACPTWRIPLTILTDYLHSIVKSPRSSSWNAMAGFCTGSGWFLFQLGTPVVSRAVGFIFGCSSPLTCIFYGVFIFRELNGQPLRAKLYSLLAALLFATAMGLMSSASS